MVADEYHRRAALALSILNNSDALGAAQAVTDARMALEGASIVDIVDIRYLDTDLVDLRYLDTHSEEER
jgi:hypothetical protein